MRHFALALPLLMLSTAVLADGTIYRCVDEDGTVIFSDRPCDAEAQAYESGSTLSVVSAPENVQDRVEANRAFVDERRERMIEARRMREEQEQVPLQVQPIPPQTRLVPYWAPPVEPRPLPERRDDERDQRFSALSGRQPGSRRDQ